MHKIIKRYSLALCVILPITYMYRMNSQGILTKRERSVQWTSLYLLLQISCFQFTKYIFFFFTKHYNLMRRSTVLSLPLQQGFPGTAQGLTLHITRDCNAGCHETKHNDIQHISIQHSNTQYNGLICDTQHNGTEHESMVIHYAECPISYCYANCHDAECCYAESRGALSIRVSNTLEHKVHIL